MSDKIKLVIDDFINNNKLFTSVDISNTIKKNGEWVSNREVSKTLGQLFDNNKYPNYKKSNIKVERTEDGTLVNAILYSPESSAESEYVNTKEKAINPSDFDFNYATINLDDKDNDDNKKNDEKDKKMSDKKNETKKADSIKKEKSKKESSRSYNKFNFL